jgi:GMP synthase (glutamine-hydrolysing)
MTNLAQAPKVLVIVHDPDDNLNEFAAPLAEAGLYLDTWDAQRDFATKPAIEALNQYSGIISLGAHNGVQDEPQLEWMQYERKIVEYALETHTPFFGLCFGSQLLASAAGGTFKPSPVPELGWTSVEMFPEAQKDPVLKELGNGLDAFHFHYDSYELPETAEILGETNGIIEAFRVGPAAWGTQFHIEVGINQQLAWLSSYRTYFEKEGIDVAEQMELSHQKWLEYRRKAHATASAFAEQVKLFAQKS